MLVYLLGINSFIGRNLYISLLKKKYQVYCLNHNEIDKLTNVKDEDIIVNFCGVNRAEKEDDYNDGNYLFIKKIIDALNHNNVKPYFIHLSSLMVKGFLNIDFNNLPLQQKYFIDSKLRAEKYLIDNFVVGDKLLIVRPSNIYGYDCAPYYNNLLVTLLYEKISGKYKTNNINKNCVRNFLSVDGLCCELVEMIESKKYGIYNVVSNKTIGLKFLLELIYSDNVPAEINITEGESNIPQLDNMPGEETVIINEDIHSLIKETEDNMKKFIETNNQIEIIKLNRLRDIKRGDMVEISGLNGQRLYMITVNDHAIRGNHYHYKQIEHFYLNKGKVVFLLAHRDNPNVIAFKVLNTDELIVVNPLIIHTLINDFIDNRCEVFVVSTQPYIPNSSPDTEYVNLLSI